MVQRAVYDSFLKKLIEKIERCKVGDPLEEGIDIGPVIDEGSAIRIQSWVEEAVAQGAKIETGGRRDRAVVLPTVLSNTQPHMKVEAEEIFGPVMTVRVYDEFEEAIARCNNSKYGLQGGFFTQKLKNAFRAIEDWEVGGLMINDVPIYRIDNMPFGGWKESGLGREGTRYAMEDMTDIRHLVINYA